MMGAPYSAAASCAYLGCIFDLDGTLADTLASIAGFVNETLAEWGLPAIPAEEIRFLVGNGAELLLRRALARVGAELPEAELPAFRAAYDRRYEAAPLKGVRAYPGLPELAAELKAAGFRLGVLSNKPDNMTRVIVRALYGELFDAVQGQREAVPKKPDPTAVLAMARDFGLPPTRILYVGDSSVDMDTARSAGMDSCGVLWGFRPREELVAHGACFLAKDAEELRAAALGRGIPVPPL